MAHPLGQELCILFRRRVIRFGLPIRHFSTPRLGRLPRRRVKYGEDLLQKYPVGDALPDDLLSSTAVIKFFADHRVHFSWAPYILHSILIHMKNNFSPKTNVDYRMGDIRGGSHFSYGTSLMEELVLLSPNNKPLFQLVESEKLYGLMLYTLGNCVVKKPEFSELGWYLIEIAVETGHPDAAIELAQLEQHSRDKIAPFKAWAVVKSLVEKGEDWRALVLYAARLVQKQTTTADRQLAYSLTQKAFRMTRPSNVLDGDLTDSSLTTWRPLQKSASDSWNRHGLLAARKDLDMAIRAGALDYQDPLACLWLARSPETLKYSKEWLELMTKAAMAGRGSSKPESTDYQQNAAEELGKYYLELHGWYPCQNGPSSQRGSSVGFDWLHVGAQQHAGKPEHMVYPYLKMASVMKENGYHQEGCKMLEQGRREIKQTWADEKQKESAAAQLQHYIDRWDQPLPADALPSFLLGDPCLHSRGYQNEATG